MPAKWHARCVKQRSDDNVVTLRQMFNNGEPPSLVPSPPIDSAERACDLRRALLTYHQRARRRREPPIMAEVKPRCRLYLQLPGEPTAKLEAQLTQALAPKRTPLVFCFAETRSAIDEHHADRLIDLVQAAGAACLIEGDAELASGLAPTACISRPTPRPIGARARCSGTEASIGVGCGLDRVTRRCCLPSLAPITSASAPHH